MWVQVKSSDHAVRSETIRNAQLLVQWIMQSFFFFAQDLFDALTNLGFDESLLRSAQKCRGNAPNVRGSFDGRVIERPSEVLYQAVRTYAELDTSAQARKAE